MEFSLTTPLESSLPVSASERLWSIPWGKLLPAPLTAAGVSLRRVSYEEAGAFAAEHFERIFDEESSSSAFRFQESGAARSHYYRLFGDVFAFSHEGRIVGIAACNPTDWASYYIRNVSLLPEYEGRNLSNAFLKLLITRLPSYGVERLELETSPANLTVIQIVTRHGFNLTGQSSTERWGNLLRFTKFLDGRAEAAFLDQFCSGRKPQLQRGPATVAIKPHVNKEDV